MYYTYHPLEWEAFIIQRMGHDGFLALKTKALAFVGPLDHRAVARELYASAEAAGIGLGDLKGIGLPGWAGMKLPEDLDKPA
jgi:hypothetical protein